MCLDDFDVASYRIYPAIKPFEDQIMHYRNYLTYLVNFQTTVKIFVVSF